MEEIDRIMNLPEFDLKNFSILDLECKVLRKYYIELASVLFINNISRYFLSEFILDHREFDKVCDPFAHKDKATMFLNIVHRKMKAGDTRIFRTMLDTLHFYGDKPLRVVVDKMKCKVFEMKVNKRGDIEQRRSDKIAGRKEKYYIQDDYPINNIPDFSTYRIILRCILKMKTTMTAIFKRVDIQIVRQACIMNARTPKGPWLSKHLMNAISLVETSEELFEMLMHYHQMDWINFSIIESLVKYTKSELGQKVLDSYKKYTLQLNFLTVYTINSRVPVIEDPGTEYTRVKEILSVDLFKMTVGKLLEHRTFLEREIFDINEASTRMASFDHNKSEVVWIIPMECSYHAYKSANNSMHKFDIILSLEIEDYPIIKNTVELPVDKPLALETTTVELVDRYGTVLLEQLDAASIVPIMVERRLLNSDEARVINSAPTEYQKNSYILERVQDMDNRGLLRFCDILQSQSHHQHIGMPMMNEIYHVEQKGNGARSPAAGEGISSNGEVTAKGKRLSSHNEQPCNKPIKLLAVSRKFAAVVREIGKSMKSVNLKVLYLWVGFQEACKEPKIHLFSSELLAGLDKCDNATMFLNRLSFQWSWMDHAFLEDLLRANRCEKGTKILEKFKSELGQVQFLSSFTVPAPCRKMLPNDEESYTILALTVDCKLLECTLHYISELKSSFTTFCGIVRHSIQLIAVRQSSVTSMIFYWIVLRQLIPLICTKVQANCTELRSTGVLDVSIYPNVVMATDAEVRIGSLALLTIHGGMFDDNVKTAMSRTKELPEVVAKLQCELNQCKSQLQEKQNVESSALCNGEDHTVNTAPADQEKYKAPSDDVVEMMTAPVNEDAECQHEAITALRSTNKDEAEKTHLIDMWLEKKSHYCLQLEKYVSKECLGQIFSTTWELREAGLQQLAKDMTFLLMPEFPCHHRSRSRNWKLPRYPHVKEIIQSCCAVVAYSFTDKVLEVYQAALKLCWVILHNALCTSEEELDELREFFKPVLSSLMARYDDRELSIRQSAKMFLQQFFHGQTGALFTINNPFGAFHTSGLFYVYSCLLTVPVHRKISENWWMTRLNFISDTFCKYGDYYFPQDDLPSLDYYHSSRASYRSREPDLPIPDEESLAVLTLVWRFISNATNRTHNRDAVSTAAQVYRNTIQIIGKYARGLERARELLVKCHPSVVDEIQEIIDGYQKRLDKSIEDGWRYNHKGYYKKLKAIAYSDLQAKSSIDSEKPAEEDPLIKMWNGKELDKDKVLALAKYQTIDVRMYPPIFLPAPHDGMIVHIQGYLAGGKTYREGMEWIKGESINDVNYLYRAQDVRTGTIMAVSQRPLSGFSTYASRKESLLNEMSLVVGLDHSNVVRYFAASMEEDRFNIFQEWIAGGSLRQLLNDTRGLHTSVVTIYAKQLIRGVAYLHGNRIIHRNLCDVTVMVDHSGQRVKVCDFGSAVKVPNSEPTEQREIPDDYKCYNVFFAAPEVLRRESYGMSSDVWSVGCCIAMMATGDSPWAIDKSCDPYIDIVRVATGKPPPVIPSTLSEQVVKWVTRCLDIRPEDRLKLLDIPEHHLVPD